MRSDRLVGGSLCCTLQMHVLVPRLTMRIEACRASIQLLSECVYMLSVPINFDHLNDDVVSVGVHSFLVRAAMNYDRLVHNAIIY